MAGRAHGPLVLYFELRSHQKIIVMIEPEGWSGAGSGQQCAVEAVLLVHRLPALSRLDKSHSSPNQPKGCGSVPEAGARDCKHNHCCGRGLAKFRSKPLLDLPWSDPE